MDTGAIVSMAWRPTASLSAATQDGPPVLHPLEGSPGSADLHRANSARALYRLSQGCVPHGPGARRAAISTRRETHARTGGFTVLEMVIGLVVAVLLLLGFKSLVATGDSSKSTDAWTEVDEKLSRLGRQVVDELKTA